MNNINVMTFPSSKKAEIVQKIMNYIKKYNILDDGFIVINEKYKEYMGLSDLSSASIDNSIEWLEFLRLVIQTNQPDKFKITDKGYEFFDYYNKNEKLNLDNIYYMLLNVTMPYKIGCTYNLNDKKYRVFETMFKVFLYLDEQNIKFDCRKFDEVYYFQINNENYKNYKEIGEKIKFVNQFSHARPVIDYLFSILDFLGVIKKTDSCIYCLTDEFKKILKENLIMNLENKNINLPRISDQTEMTKLPYNSKFVSFTLREYLFSGKALLPIEKEFYNGENQGFLSRDVLRFYRINIPENKGMYSNTKFEDVINLLNSQSSEIYKDLASALIGDLSVNINNPILFDKSKIIVKNAYNKIYYGIPGCGKSYKVREEYEKPENIVTRVTFHPEYSNSDFVGQIIPKVVNDQVIYEFKEGPFTEALIKAYKNPDKKNVLIIEEINRGNASAIFGDIFQLLDRDDYGNSEYPIDNNAIHDCLLKNGLDVQKIFLPSNLWIIATMNTSDQNVFTLDTAFKRRWKMHRIPNVFESNNELAKMYIPGTYTTWKNFVISINNAIIEKNKMGINSEDKQLGVYFVGKEDLTYKYDDSKELSSSFAEKVLLYIWDDIAKIDPIEWFENDCNTFDELLSEFLEKHLEIFKGIDFDTEEPNKEDN